MAHRLITLQTRYTGFCTHEQPEQPSLRHIRPGVLPFTGQRAGVAPTCGWKQVHWFQPRAATWSLPVAWGFFAGEAGGRVMSDVVCRFCNGQSAAGCNYCRPVINQGVTVTKIVPELIFEDICESCAEKDKRIDDQAEQISTLKYRENFNKRRIRSLENQLQTITDAMKKLDVCPACFSVSGMTFPDDDYFYCKDCNFPDVVVEVGE